MTQEQYQQLQKVISQAKTKDELLDIAHQLHPLPATQSKTDLLNSIAFKMVNLR